MKPETYKPNYLSTYVITLFDTKGEEVKQVQVVQSKGFTESLADDMVRNYPIGFSYHITQPLTLGQ